MIKRLLMLLVLLGVHLSAEEIDTSWVREYNGSGDTLDAVMDMIVDDAGNVYVTGYSFGVGSEEDYATVKYDSDGNEIWVKRYNGSTSEDDRPAAIALDTNRNVFVSGQSREASPNFQDYLTIKYTPEGDTTWIRRYVRGGSDFVYDMKVDLAGNCYVTGFMSPTEAPAGTIKYLPNGDTAWVRKYNGVGNRASGLSIEVDNDGFVYVGGWFKVDPDSASDFLVIKYEPDGDTSWVRTYDGPVGGDDLGRDLALDPSGNIFIAGNSENALGEFDFLLIKYDSDGNELWAERFSQGVTNSNDSKFLAIDSLGNSYICGVGYSGGTADFVIAKYLPSGDTAWVRIFDFGSYEYPSDIDVDEDLNVYAVGNGGMVKYDSDGNLVWYDETFIGLREIIADEAGIFYVAGNKSNPGNSTDFVTVKYHISKFDYITYPTQNEINVPVTTNIEVIFPIDMIPGTIMDTTFVVNSQFSGRIGGYITYNSDTRTATFDPDSIFAPGETVTVVLTQGIYAVEGGALDESYSWSFTTGVGGGFGNFIHDADYAVGQNMYAPVAFSFDADEWIDIAVVGDSLFVLQNSGNGSFTKAIAYDVDVVQDLVASDFDGNGCMDLATVDLICERVLVFLNGCDNTFLPYTDYIIMPSYPKTLSAFDIESDGDMDLAAAGDTGLVAILINDGSGDFFEDVGSSFDAGDNITDIGAADLDGSGFVDIMILDSSNYKMKIYLNDGTGHFALDSAYDISIGSRFEHTDLNNDGYEDICISSGIGWFLTILLNGGNGQFEVNQIEHFQFATHIATGDFDNDNDMDYALSADIDYLFYILFNNSDGSFDTPAKFIPSPQRTNGGIRSADVDNDGDLDIITSETDSGYISIFLNERTPADYIITPVDTSDLYYVQTADLDRDNYLDVAYTGSVESGLFVAYGDPDDTLTEPIKYLDINQGALSLQYFNEDSLLDIIAVTSSNLYILENLGNRNFDSNSVPLKSFGRETVPAVATGLLNDDLAFDIVYAPDQVQFGDGYGGFLGGPSTLAFSFETASVGDFDYDGLDDLLVTDGDYVEIYINLGSGTSYSQVASELLGAASLEVPPTSAVTDFNRDRQLDFALVQPMATPSGTSKIFVGLGDGTGGLVQFSSLEVSGIAYDLVVCDVDRDVNMDIVIANGSAQRIEIYYGDGLGGFDDPEFVDIPAGTDMIYVLSTIDLNRDGLPDYISGGPDGDYMNAVIDEGDGSTETLDEMVVTGYSSITLEIINPDGHVISQYYQTVPGADYWRRDVNDDGYLDEESYDYNLQYGEYTIIIRGRPGSGGLSFDVGVRVDGTVYATTHLNYAQPKKGGMKEDSLVFYYTVETESSIQPPNGIPTSSMPVFDWSGLVDDGRLIDSFQFQLDRFMDFSAPMYDMNGLTESHCTLPAKLGVDSVFYWQFRSFSGDIPSEYSRTFAAYIAYEACGDANGDADVNVSDAVSIINYVFVGGNPPEPLKVGDVNCDGTCNVSDAVWIINYVFVGGNVPCDTSGDGLPDC
jgi:hypothetical protein